MIPLDEDRLKATLGHEELKDVVVRIRRRLLRDREVRGRMTLRKYTAQERQRLGSLLGRHFPAGSGISIDLVELDRMLREAEICAGLMAAITHLTGPLIHPKEIKAAARERRRVMFDRARARDERAAVLAWLDDLEARGTLRRICDDEAHEERLLDQAMAVAARLPAEGILIKELAAQVFGDAHALDENHRLTALVHSLISFFRERASATDAEERRAQWHEVGVIPDELSVSVLVLNLNGERDTLAGRLLTECSAVGEPLRLSLSQLRWELPKLVKPDEVFICENPAVVQTAAQRLGASSKPLICTEGRPNTACHLLLDLVKPATLFYHGDFDWQGINIANQMVLRHQVKPWRMSVADYEEAPGELPLSGDTVKPIWEAELLYAMRKRGLAVHEEAVMERLLSDLE